MYRPSSMSSFTILFGRNPEVLLPNFLRLDFSFEPWLCIPMYNTNCTPKYSPRASWKTLDLFKLPSSTNNIIIYVLGRGGLRIVYGVLPDLGEEAYGLFTDFYQLWGRIGGKGLADCFWIGTGFGGEGLRIWGWGSLGAGTLKQQPASACAQVHWHTYSSDRQRPISITKSM